MNALTWLRELASWAGQHPTMLVVVFLLGAFLGIAVMALVTAAGSADREADDAAQIRDLTREKLDRINAQDRATAATMRERAGLRLEPDPIDVESGC